MITNIMAYRAIQRKFIRMEIKKVPLKPHIAGLLAANFIIFLLSVFTSSRTKLIMSKLILICGIMFLFHVLSNIFQYASIFLAGK